MVALPSAQRHVTKCTVGWVDPTAGLERGGKSRQHLHSIPGLWITYRIAVPTRLSRPKEMRFLYKMKFNIYAYFKNPHVPLFAEQVIEGKTEERLGIRRKQLPDDLKGKRG